MHDVGERQEFINSTWLYSGDLGERAPAFDRCVELRTLLLVQPGERQMFTLARCESREVESGAGQHGHASEAVPVCGHRQTGVAEPVQIPGDGSQGFENLSPDVPRTSEVCLAIDGGPDELKATFEQWKSKGVTILREPHDAGFGLPFLAADPDGNRIRVAPQD